jgi:hypothetical protein
MLITSRMMKRAVSELFDYEVIRNGKVSSHSQLERWLVTELSAYQPQNSAKCLQLILKEIRNIDFDIHDDTDVDIDVKIDRLRDAYGAQGFSHGGTGGGCTAFTKMFSDGEMMVTDAEGADVPAGLSEPVTCGIYDGGGNVIDSKTFDNTHDLLSSYWFQWMNDNLIK